MSIEISPEIEKMVLGIFATGRFASESEVVSAAVCLLRDRQQLLDDIEQGRRELAAGQRIDADTLFAELRGHAAQLDRPQA
jgi:Arc/MetJ-type ribon-helix-helix transcriptional regulator